MPLARAAEALVLEQPHVLFEPADLLGLLGKRLMLAKRERTECFGILRKLDRRAHYAP